MNDIIEKIEKHTDQVKTVSKPLHDYFSIPYFYHFRLNEKGKYILLTSHPEIESFYFSEEIFHDDPYLKHPGNYEDEFFLMETYASCEYREDLKLVTGQFDLCPWICMTEKNETSYDFFGFWGNTDNSTNHKNLKPSDIKLLKSFTRHHKQKFNKLLSNEDETWADVFDLVSKDHFYEGVDESLQDNKVLHRKYLKEIGFEKQVYEADSLSQREKECLKQLTLGKTAKETAILLCLSHRTIEHYLENAKLKLSIWNKRELFSKAESLNELGLI